MHNFHLKKFASKNDNNIACTHSYRPTHTQVTYADLVEQREQDRDRDSGKEIDGKKIKTKLFMKFRTID